LKQSIHSKKKQFSKTYKKNDLINTINVIDEYKNKTISSIKFLKRYATILFKIINKL